MGISNAEKKLNYLKTVICSRCSQFGRFEVFMTYTYLSLFFIPTFKWGRHYYVRTSCCNTLYDLDPSIGKRILHGEDVDIKDEDLTLVKGKNDEYKKCSSCGYLANSDFEYCPKCGKQL